MENRNSIPDKAHHLVCLHQLKCNNMVKNHEKNQQYLYIIYKIGIWNFLFPGILAHLRHLYTPNMFVNTDMSIL